MLKRKTPKEVIESINLPELEEAWVKLPRQEPKSISLVRKEGRVHSRGEKGSSYIHTHPCYQREPSSGDFTGFLSSTDKKTMIVAETNPKNGKLMGYFIVRKTKETPLLNPLYVLFDRMMDAIGLGLYRGRTIGTELKNLRRFESDDLEYQKKFEELMSKYHLKYKYLPARNVSDSKEETKKSLEGKLVMAISISGFMLSIFFLSSNVTGNAISELNQMSTNWAAVIFFFIGVVGAFFYFRKGRI